MRFVVRQTGVGFCHMEQMSCFGEDHGTLGALMRTLIDRKKNAPAGSYTKRLFDDEALLKSKLLEECEELIAAKDKSEVRENKNLCVCVHSSAYDTQAPLQRLSSQRTRI